MSLKYLIWGTENNYQVIKKKKTSMFSKLSFSWVNSYLTTGNKKFLD
jgi:hypothetical protein